MNLTDKMAYLRGMVDGMELDLTTTKRRKSTGTAAGRDAGNDCVCHRPADTGR